MGDALRVSDVTTRVQSRYSGAWKRRDAVKVPLLSYWPSGGNLLSITWRKYPTQPFQARCCGCGGSLFSVQFMGEGEKVGGVAGRRCAAVRNSGRLLLRSCRTSLGRAAPGYRLQVVERPHAFINRNLNALPHKLRGSKNPRISLSLYPSTPPPLSLTRTRIKSRTLGALCWTHLKCVCHFKKDNKVIFAQTGCPSILFSLPPPQRLFYCQSKGSVQKDAD